LTHFEATSLAVRANSLAKLVASCGVISNSVLAGNVVRPPPSGA
jgi:hypothetical protein